MHAFMIDGHGGLSPCRLVQGTVQLECSICRSPSSRMCSRVGRHRSIVLMHARYTGTTHHRCGWHCSCARTGPSTGPSQPACQPGCPTRASWSRPCSAQHTLQAAVCKVFSNSTILYACFAQLPTTPWRLDVVWPCLVALFGLAMSTQRAHHTGRHRPSRHPTG